MADTPDNGAGGAVRPLDYIREQVRADNAAGTFGGRVQTRFPPEPNGFPHIGHAKAVCLNFEVAAEHGGTCRLRFDDTNPEGEDAVYAQAIADDVAWLGYEPDGPAVHASDYFEQLYEWAEYLVRAGLAYVDDQDAETISATRGDFSTPGVESPWRDRPVDENLSLLRDMRAGHFGDGARVLRAKIDMAHPNMLMRDPVMYRIRHTAHFRTGDAWCIYPTYDWAHGQSDAIEGVTHSLCSLEFDAHRQLYDWYLEHLPLPGDRPRQYEFARLNLTHTVTSKRKLNTLIDQGLVDGWDDPRLPTLRGLRRRGYPPEAIRGFCAHIGVARVNGVHEIELLESFVRTHHNRTALRRMAVLRPLEVVIDNWPRISRVEWRRVRAIQAKFRRGPVGDGPVHHMETSQGCQQSRRPPGRSPGGAVVRTAVDRAGRLHARPTPQVLPPSTGPRGPPAGRLLPALQRRRDRLRRTGGAAVLHLRPPKTGDGQAPDGRKVRATIHWVSARLCRGRHRGAVRPAVHRPCPRR